MARVRCERELTGRKMGKGKRDKVGGRVEMG
jgi:hypothetical protein